ncbi:site-specific integrase [Geothrix sp. 21YS21S-2]|uniref:tyrosine-type recombinase/integrase n=1 Tax=Geothrix sp. 21YS21S-2 TaxID=3068893 RepID=UPI0027B8A991|nr:site-specific integrase [Geothrix sp. 21YS21S-2]
MPAPKLKAPIIKLATKEEAVAKDRVSRGGLKKRGRYYHYRFEVEGHEYTGSTKQETLKEAKKELERQRQKIHHRTKGTPFNPLLSELITEWEKTQRADNHSEKHIANCSRLFKDHVYPVIKEHFNHETGDIKLDSFTDKMVEQIKIEYQKTHTEHGCNTLLRYVSGILKYGNKNYKIDIPAVSKLKAQKKPITYLDEEEIFTFLDHIDFKNSKAGNGAKVPLNVQISFAVRVMLFMGFREDEVLDMTWNNYNAKNMTYTLNQDTKGGESPTVAVPEEVAEWLPKLKVNGAYLLHQPDGSRHHEGYTSNPIRRASKKMGRNFGPHELRRTHGCMLAFLQTGAFTIQKALRHKSIATSQAYVDIANRVVAEAQGKMMENLRKNREARKQKADIEASKK